MEREGGFVFAAAATAILAANSLSLAPRFFCFLLLSKVRLGTVRCYKVR